MFKKKFMTMKVMRFAGLFCAGVTMTMLSSCGGSAEQQQAPKPKIATMTVAYGNSELQSGYPAIIKGKTDIQVRPQVTGFITKVHVDEGDAVKKGQVLFTLDQVQYEAAVNNAAAAVNVAEEAVKTAQLTADNKKTLYDKGIISQYEYQLAVNQLAQAKAQLAQAEAGLVNARKNLSYTVVTAPSDGVVGAIPNREGSLASPSSAQPLTTVSDNSQVYAYFSLNEKDILDLTNNGEFSLESRISAMPEVQLQLANGSIYGSTGKVATISGVIDNTTGAASVRALFDNPNGMLRSGSTGSILIPHRNDSVIIIPQKATFEMQDIRCVYVITADSAKAVSTPIQVLDINNGKDFVVLSGLKPGDRIAIEGVGTQVKDGTFIEPVEAQ